MVTLQTKPSQLARSASQGGIHSVSMAPPPPPAGASRVPRQPRESLGGWGRGAVLVWPLWRRVAWGLVLRSISLRHFSSMWLLWSVAVCHVSLWKCINSLGAYGAHGDDVHKVKNYTVLSYITLIIMSDRDSYWKLSWTFSHQAIKDVIIYSEAVLLVVNHVRSWTEWRPVLVTRRDCDLSVQLYDPWVCGATCIAVCSRSRPRSATPAHHLILWVRLWGGGKSRAGFIKFYVQQLNSAVIVSPFINLVRVLGSEWVSPSSIQAFI